MSQDPELFSPLPIHIEVNRTLEREEILNGLRQSQKQISPKYFYDGRGSRLFEEICKLKEYYPTRTEIAILKNNRDEICEYLGDNSALIELGSGEGIKTDLLLEAIADGGTYVPIEISETALIDSVRKIRAKYPQLKVQPLCADYTRDILLPLGRSFDRKLVFFPGSTIGNFDPKQALGFLQKIHSWLSPGAGYLLIGVDLVKDAQTLERAYDDAEGVTAEFNLNVLRRFNREHGSNFVLENFQHRAVFNQVASRIEMHLDVVRNNSVHFAGERIHFTRGESIHTESSYKYTIDTFKKLGQSAGFVPVKTFVDPDKLFSVHLLAAVQ